MRSWLVAFAAASAVIGLRVPVAGAQTTGHATSGMVPILFNDHTVDATPDTLRRGRVLAALVSGRQIFVPLRSMFEAMGATVSVSDDGRTVTAEKPGSRIAVTVGKREAVINGEVRPLDVAPLRYHGIVLVPVRVISEALGAYVQWVPSEHVVVVRTVPVIVPPAATPAPPPPAPASTPAPPPAPAPSLEPPHVAPYGFIQAAISDASNYNEFVSGPRCHTYLIDAAFALRSSPLAFKVDYRNDSYVTDDNRTDVNGNQYTQFATIDGGTAFTPVFLARDSSIDVRLEYQIAAPRVYLGVGYLHTENNYGYPALDGVGAGIEKLPGMHTGVDVYGSAFYYPSASGTYTVNEPGSIDAGETYRQRYAVVRYDVGAALVSARVPVYLYGGYRGDRYYAKENAPIGRLHEGPYIGLGVKL